MGFHLNPGNSGFSRIRNDLYVDKSGLIALINKTIDTTRSLTCVSRPRRFGKSFAAQMLCAYYDRTCDSSMLFHDLAIAKDTGYAKLLNQYDVIYVDMTGVRPFSNNYRSIVSYLNQKITEELKDAYPKIKPGLDLPYALDSVVNLSGNRFIMIIDEWDAPIREVPEIQEEYLMFLRSLFKNSAITAKVFAAVYMTGILPIKKDGSQSAISDFQEFTMLKPGPFAQYVGFTEEEVRQLCEDASADYSEMKAWYDGYSLRGVGSIYNPNSVVKSLLYGDYDSYWTETSAAGSLMNYICRDVDGLRKTVAELIGGVEVAVDTKGFSNDLITFRGRDDILTLLIHLGYLAYDESTKKARIPNEEVRLEFVRAIREDTSPDTMKRVQESDQLIMDTIHMNAEAVAEQIEKVHIEATNPLNANNENSLRAVIQLAYFSYKNHYMKMEELPTGYGYADIVYLPKQSEMVPALVIELKWNQSADTAIEQIKQRKYPTVLQGYGGDILLVGINYDKDAPAGQRKYTCKIENWRG
ncbi:MAG: AAA family ATPase [Clostridia bacterium]|nr:AAA family ATPase [Clostridia bacterium]